jgi:two-component system, OmpR family, sensor histidine kinase CpxA
MTFRFPLYAKILAWFFLNLILVAAIFLILLRGQFHSGLDWLLEAGAGQRIQSVCDVLMADIADRPRSEWSQILSRFDEAYQLRFYLFDNSEGAQVAGEPIELPLKVKARLPTPRGLGLPAPPGAGPPHRGPPEGIGRRFQRMPGPLGGDNPKHIVRTTNPTRYWVLVRMGVPGPGMPQPMPTTLIVASDSLSGGGLFFDFKPWLAVGFGVIVLSGALWFPFVRSLTRSIGQMTLATQQIAEGRFDGRVDEHRQDEVGALGKSINRMAERLAGFVLGQKRFLGDIAHELCAPIARTQVALGILEQRADPQNKGYVEDLREEVEHMSNLVNELLSFSKASLGATTRQLKNTELRAIAESAIGRESVANQNIRLEVPAGLSASADPEMLLRALSNLVRNAIRYAGHAGPIRVAANQAGRQVFLVVSDSGPGVPEPELQRIFDPFYRLDTSRDATTGGVGLGLAIVKTCVESCRGSISCRNRKPSGLEVTIQLQAAHEGSESSSETPKTNLGP